MIKKTSLSLFEGIGVEIEYMIVSRETLDVLPVSDDVIRTVSGKYSNEYIKGNMGWSNEFVLHVMEVKNILPRSSLKGLAAAFHHEIKQINHILSHVGGCLMPSAMHPWMNPQKETKLWPHRYRKIYDTYDRIFKCRRHGWANLQSVHVNISFCNDDEFERLHAAVRLLLPIIPALAASSPVAGGKVTGMHDTRLFHYRSNQRNIPSISGKVIPEPVYAVRNYRKTILERMYRDISRHDPEGTIQHEWLNSRGAIPRFERNAMEIRLIDTQECPAANIAVSEFAVAAIKQLLSEQWASLEDQKKWKVTPLLSIFNKTVKQGEDAIIDNSAYLSMFGYPEAKATGRDLWRYLAEESRKKKLLRQVSMKIIKSILDRGTLSTRILRALGKNPTHDRIKDVYRKLCKCLAGNKLFME